MLHEVPCQEQLAKVVADFINEHGYVPCPQMLRYDREKWSVVHVPMGCVTCCKKKRTMLTKRSLSLVLISQNSTMI